MTRIRLAATAAVLALSMLVGAVVAGALEVAHADGRQTGTVIGSAQLCPLGDAEAWAACVEDYRASFNPTAQGDGGDLLDADEPEAVTCSLVTGCTVNVVDGDGLTVKVMHITFTDAEAAEVALE